MSSVREEQLVCDNSDSQGEEDFAIRLVMRMRRRLMKKRRIMMKRMRMRMRMRINIKRSDAQPRREVPGREF